MTEEPSLGANLSGFFKWTIQKKLALFSLLATLPIIFIGFYTYKISKDILQERIGQGLQQQAVQVMDHIDRMLFERSQNVDGWSQNALMNGILKGDADGRISEFLILLKRDYGFYADIVCADKDGRIVASSGERLLGKNVASAKWFQQGLSSQRVQSQDLELLEHFGGYGIIFYAPIHPQFADQGTERSDSGSIGVLAAVLNWSEILTLVNTLQILEKSEQDKSAYAALINSEGLLLTQPFFDEEDRILQKGFKMKSLQAAQGAGGKKNGFAIEKGLYGTDDLMGYAISEGYRDFKGFGWSLLIFQNAKNAFQVINSLRLKMFFISLLIIFSVGFLSLFIAHSITRPIKHLTLVTTEIAKEKDLSRRVHIKSEDEIGQLAEAFNRMVGDLEKASAQRQKMEQIVLQSEKMAAVGQLAGGVAHEINNPLGVILGFAQGVAKRISPGDPFEMPLKSIEREALRCKQLVQDLLTFSRIGKMEKDHTNLNEAIEGALSLVMAYAKTKNVQLVKEFASDIPTVFINRSQIQQVIVNLSNNAMDAMPSGGTLTLRTKYSMLNEKEAVEIQIQDTGQGIPNEIQAKIFEPFFTTKEVGKGTGLGLSLVFEIVQKHEGRISVESEIGKGALFRICLPVH